MHNMPAVDQICHPLTPSPLLLVCPLAQIYVWSMKTGRLLDILAGHEGPVSGLAFSPRQPLLASSSWDRTVRTWDVFDGKVGGWGCSGCCCLAMTMLALGGLDIWQHWRPVLCHLLSCC